MEYTQEQIAQHYKGCLDSVALINGEKPSGISDEDWAKILEANKKHLHIMLDKPFWTDEDLSSIVAAAGPSTTPLTLTDFDRALTIHLDSVAKEHRYDNRITCALRAGYVGPFQAEGIAFASWMDTCNAMAYVLLGEIQAGTRELPTSTQALIDLLPIMEWPE